MRKLFSITTLAALLAFAAPMSHATLLNFDLLYSGASFGNNATASGSITIDDAILPNPGSLINVTSAAMGVTAFTITVAGASSGNGTFGLSDVTNWIWITGSPLNLGLELVGQTGFNDFNWCGTNFVGCVAPAPGGVATFTIRADAETGDQMTLVSMQSVPEPASLALLGLGLAGLGLGRRNRKSAQT